MNAMLKLGCPAPPAGRCGGQASIELPAEYCSQELPHLTRLSDQRVAALASLLAFAPAVCV